MKKHEKLLTEDQYKAGQHMCKTSRTSESGFTLVELIIAGGVFAVGMVLVCGSVVAAYNHNQMTQARGAAADFNENALENLRGLDLNQLLTYEMPEDDPVEGTVNIPGFGTAEVAVYAVIPSAVQGGAPTYFETGVDDPASVVDPPNPIEVQIVMVRSSGGQQSSSAEHYKISTMVGY